MNALATVLAQLAVAILQWVASREDLKQTVYDKVDKEAAARALVALLTMVLGCAHSQGPSPFRVVIPTIMAPRTIACQVNGQPEMCTVLITRDFEAIVRQLKAACLALGQSAKECLTENTP